MFLFFIFVMADVQAIRFEANGVIGKCYCHIAMYLQLIFFCLADVVALLLYCFRMDGDVFTIRLMFLPCWLTL